MGCHTWFYKLLDKQPTKEDKINACVKNDKKFKGKIIEALENGGFVYACGEKSWYPFENEAEAREHVKLLDWRIENACHYDDYEKDYNSIDWNTCKEFTKEQELYASVEHYNPYGISRIVHIHNGKYYEELKKYHDAFRFYEYGKILESKEDTYGLLESGQCTLDVDTYKLVDDFWEKYPNGLIEFG